MRQVMRRSVNSDWRRWPRCSATSAPGDIRRNLICPAPAEDAGDADGEHSPNAVMSLVDRLPFTRSPSR